MNCILCNYAKLEEV